MRRNVGVVALAAGLTLAAVSVSQAAVTDSVANGLASTGAVSQLVAAPLAPDSPIAVNQWYTFTFVGGAGAAFANGSEGEPGTDPASIAAPNPAWMFTLPSAGGTLVVVDGFMSGDQFNVTDSGTSLGNTSVPTLGASCGNDITACLNDPALSQGSFTLAAGAHAIDGTAIASPFGGGSAFFEVVSSTTSVPEPVSLALLGSGLLGIGAVRGRRRV